MGTVTVNAEPGGFAADAGVGMTIGLPLEYHHGNGGYAGYYPQDVWVSSFQGAFFTLEGTTRIERGQDDYSLISYSTVSRLTFYRPVYENGGFAGIEKIGTGTMPDFSFIGGGSYNSYDRGIYDLYHYEGRENSEHYFDTTAFSSHLASHDWVFNGADAADTIDAEFVSGPGRTVTFNGNGGDDTYYGSDFASNILIGGSGNDHLDVSRYNEDKFYRTNLIDGGEDDDYIYYSDNQGDSGRLLGGSGNDRIILYGLGEHVLVGGAGDDLLEGDFDNQGETAEYSGRRSDYSIVAESSGLVITDTRAGSPDGKDVLYKIDYLKFSDGIFSIDEALNIGVTINGTDSSDNISPTKTVAGQSKSTVYNDTIYGNGGNDIIDGGAGADILYGGAGNDTYYIDITGDRVIELSASDGSDSVIANASFALADYVENLTLASAKAAALNGTGNDLANKITGNEFANVLTGASGNDTLTGNAGSDTLYGDAGTDTLSGGIDNDTLYGGADADKLDGGSGADVMQGGSGNDTYAVDNAGDTIDESDDATGLDLVNASVSFSLGTNVENLVLTGTASIDGTGNELANKISGNAGNNVLRGNGGNDVLTGNAGTDTLYGDSGTDTLSGGADADTLYGGADADKLDGGLGADAMRGGTGNDTYTVDNMGDTVDESDDATGLDLVSSSVGLSLGTNVENLTLTGTATINGTGNVLANKITGNAAANILSGEGGADTLTGGLGNDILIGGAGTDTLVGGSGTDTFLFGPADATSTDKVSDFSSLAGDKLQFAASDFGMSLGQGLNADGTLSTGYFATVSGKTTVATADHGQFLFNTTNKTLFWDADGTGGGTSSKAPVAVATFTIASGSDLTNFLHGSDFHLI